VLAAWESQEIPIHIVGFDIPENEFEQANQEFQAIAGRTGGRFVSAFTAPALIQSLEVLLGPANYRVVSADGEEIDRAQLGSDVTISLPEGPNQKFFVISESVEEEIELAGGESLELELSRQAEKITSLPYTRDFPKFAPLVEGTPGVPTRLRVGVHRPMRTDDGVQFTVSIQNADGRFTPRPKDLWVEITPRLSNDESDEKFIYYDTNYEPDTTVPVQQFLARNWPRDAHRAEIRLWCKAQKTKPTATIPIEEIANQAPPSTGGFSISSIEEITVQIRSRINEQDHPFYASVVEHYPNNVLSVDQLKIEIVPPTQRIIHQFNIQPPVVVHSFIDNAVDNFHEGSAIHITLRKDIHHGAWRLSQPVVVEIGDKGDLIEPTEITE